VEAAYPIAGVRSIAAGAGKGESTAPFRTNTIALATLINTLSFFRRMPVFPSNHDETYKRCIQAGRFRVKWKDIFNVKEFYRALHEWSLEYDWKDMEDQLDHYETLYFEKVGLFGDKELWNRWRWQKIPNENSYYKYHIDLDFHYLYLVPTEVVREGKKFKKDIYKGEVEVWITALIELDYHGQWSRHPLIRHFNKIFPERIWQKDLYEEHRRELYREAYVLQNFIKQWFRLKRYLPYEEVELFFPSLAYSTHQAPET